MSLRYDCTRQNYSNLFRSVHLHFAHMFCSHCIDQENCQVMHFKTEEQRATSFNSLTTQIRQQRAATMSGCFRVIFMLKRS